MCVSETTSSLEDIEEHTARQLAGIGVLERGMEAGDQIATAGKGVFGAMGELERRFAFTPVGPHQVLHIAVEGDPAEADNHAQISQQGDLPIKVRRAVP